MVVLNGGRRSFHDLDQAAGLRCNLLLKRQKDFELHSVHGDHPVQRVPHPTRSPATCSNGASPGTLLRGVTLALAGSQFYGEAGVQVGYFLDPISSSQRRNA